jgi:hypothetical protein
MNIANAALKTARLCSISAFTALAASVVSLTALAEEQQPTISGRVLDHARQPLSGIQVRLFQEGGDFDMSSTSGADGGFTFEHKPAGKLSLQVVPDPKFGLANALIEGIPGDQGRNFAIVLQRGFAVRGRVVSGSKGLKGIPVRVISAESGFDPRHVHGGGFSLTNRDGSFEMVLTPGPKHLEIMNDRYRNLISHFDKEFTVTSDMRLSDLVLPPAH